MTETHTSRTSAEVPEDVDQNGLAEAPDPPVNASSVEEASSIIGDASSGSRRQTPRIFTSPVREPGLPEASPDGAWVAYLYPTEDDLRELGLSPVAGGDAVRLDVPFAPVDDVDPESGRHIRGPQWSPDGKTLALTGMHPDGDRTAVWLVQLEMPAASDAPSPDPDPAHAEAEQPDTDNAPVGESDPEPEAVSSEASKEPSAPVAGSTRLLIDHADADRSPRWSPDGMLMLVVTARDGVDQIALAQPGFEDVAPLVEPITSGLLAHREPIWSRDGRFIAFTRQNGEDYRFADILAFELQTGELKNLTGEKAANVRHSLDSVPGRNLISFVTRDGDWYGVAVVNVDNKAGWMITREAGDKHSPRFAPNEARLVYIRSEGFSTVLAERGLHGSGTIALDPGEGVASRPIWAGEANVVYGFSAPQKPLGWLAQENSADAERTPLTLPEMVTVGDAKPRHPVPVEFDVGPEEQFSGLLYQTDGVSGPVPGIVYVPDGPLQARLAGFQREEQALASSGMAVLAPVIHGASGFGTAVEDDLAEYSDGELEAADLAAAGEAMGERDSVDASKLVLIGHGYGGALAMVAAGARPGVFRMVVAIDPVTDWTIELDQADRAWRQWITRQYGLPLTHADRYALRTPETFAEVIDADLLLVSTPVASESRKAQLTSLVGWLDEVGIRYTRVELDVPTPAAALYEIGQLLAERLRTASDPDNF